MPARSIFLTGAPRPSALTWEESELLDGCWFCLVENKASASGDEHSSRWRVVGCANPEAGDYDAAKDGNHAQTSFLSMGPIERYSGLQETMSQEQDMISDFYDHSFQLHEGFQSFEKSRSLSYDDSDTYGDTSIEDVSINPSAASQRADDGHKDEGANVPSIQPGHLSDLEDIPSATYLQSIAPQTVIVNLIVAIVTIHPRKRVKTRWGNFMDIVEVVVGDETRSGFGITCWLPPTFGSETANKKNLLDQALRNLRPRDIVLFRSAALSTFRGQVYGQSLRQNKTTVDLLHRQAVDATDSCGLFTSTKLMAGNSSDRLLTKVRRVRNWIARYVQPGLASEVNDLLPGQGEKAGAVIPRALPPDTQ